MDRQRAVLQRKELVAQQIEQGAGIRAIRRGGGREFINSFAQIVEEQQPRERIRVLAASGAFLLQGRQTVLDTLMVHGIRVELLLLDPRSNNWIFEQYPWLKQEPLLESLLFVDDQVLFLSSYIPIGIERGLIYEIRRGQRSLYNLYEDAFTFFWTRSERAERPD